MHRKPFPPAPPLLFLFLLLLQQAPPGVKSGSRTRAGSLLEFDAVPAEIQSAVTPIARPTLSTVAYRTSAAGCSLAPADLPIQQRDRV